MYDANIIMILMKLDIKYRDEDTVLKISLSNLY